jgi:predicted Fe-Mo cluster-binding NifX family protein
MKIAFTTKGTTWDAEMDPRFGRAEYFLIYDKDNDELSHYDNSDASNDAHGAGPKTSQKLFELHPDVLITGNGPGGNAAAVLEKTGIKIYTGAGEMTVSEAYKAFENNNLTPFK